MRSSDDLLNDEALASHAARFPSSLNSLMFPQRRRLFRDLIKLEYKLADRARLVSGIGGNGTYVRIKSLAVPDERANSVYFLYRGCDPKFQFHAGGFYRENDVVNAYFKMSRERKNLTVTAFFPLGFESWCQLVGNPAFGVRYVHHDGRHTSVCGLHVSSDAVGMLFSACLKMTAFLKLSAVAFVTQTAQLCCIAAQFSFRHCTATYCLESGGQSRAQVFVHVSKQARVAVSFYPKIGVELELKRE